MYDFIILGATFASAGLAHILEKRCLIIEESLQAGGEFYSALNFGKDYYSLVKNTESEKLKELFISKGVYGSDSFIYPYLSKADVLFGTSVLSIDSTDLGFLCSVHSVEGFETFEAKNIIDTRSNENISISKSFNLLFESKIIPENLGVEFEKAFMENHYVLKITVPLCYGYYEARKDAIKVIEKFTAEQKLIISASTFDYEVKPDYKQCSNGIISLPSKVFSNPVLSFDAGINVGKELSL